MVFQAVFAKFFRLFFFYFFSEIPKKLRKFIVFFVGKTQENYVFIRKQLIYK